MTERPEQPSDANQQNGGWHTPDTPNLWQAPKQSAQPEAIWREVDALPQDMSQEPDATGGWHLPKPEDTLYNVGDKVEISDKSQAPTTGTSPVVLRPEDIIAQLTGQPVKRAARPEDTDFGIYEPPIDEDDTQPEDAVDEDETIMLDDETGMSNLEALGALDDDDSEAFSMSELTALAALAAENDELPDNIGRDDLSPAEWLLFNKAADADNELSYRGVDDGATQTLSDTSQQPAAGDNNADYIQERLREIESDNQQPAQEFGTDYGTPQSLTLTPEQEALAAQFRETRRQVGVLRQRFEQGQIDYQQLQTELQNISILDPQENWWMLGYESDQWFRFDKVSNQWQAAEPPVPLDAPSPATMTGTGGMPRVLENSLPYIQGDGGTIDIGEYTEDYDPTQYDTAQGNFTEQYGVEEGYTPIPNPNQPTHDPNLTMVGNVAHTSNLPPGTDPTVQNMNVVDGFDPNQTMPSINFDDDPSIGSMMTQRAGAYPGEYDDVDTGAPAYLDDQAVPEVVVAARRTQTQQILFALGILSAIAVVLVLVGGIIFVLSMYNWYTNTVEPYRAAIAALAEYQPEFQVARVMDASGTEIMELTGQEGSRVPVTIEAGEVSPYFVHAVISSEDPTFYENPGLNPLSIARAFVQNLRSGTIESGASSITQQIARELILGGDRSQTAQRKATEIAIALEIANQYSKNQVLDIYINEFPFGNQTFGVEAASQLYFNIPAADLNMAQAALLAGILPQPSSWNPVQDREQAFVVMDVVVQRMMNKGCLNFQHGEWLDSGPFCINENTIYDGETLYRQANNNVGYSGPLLIQRTLVVSDTYQIPEAEFVYPHFRRFIIDQIEAVYGPNALYQRGFTIYTTLIPSLQERAELELANGVQAYALNRVNTGAVIVLDPSSGAIRALVGSPDFFDDSIDGQVDNTRTLQQPGSAIKPIVYTAALTGTPASGYLTPASILWDVPSSYPLGNGTNYNPVNFDGQYRGPVTVRNALAQSLNVPAVKAFEFIGAEAFVNTGRAMGLEFHTEATFGLASALGANDVRLLDMAEAYGTLAADGVYHRAFAIVRITERIDGRNVDVNLDGTGLNQQAPVQAVAPSIAYLLQNILSDDNARAPQFGQNGAMSGLSLNLPNQNYVAAKTGTSNDARDLWTVGFTNNFVVGVWVGTVDNSPTTGNLTGSRVAAPIWNGIMRHAVTSSGGNPGAMDPPPGVVEATVCRLTGAIAENPADCPSERVTERFASDHMPPQVGFVQTIQVDSWTGLRANQWCSDYIVERTYSNIRDAFAVNWLNSTGGGQQILAALGLSGGLSAPPANECQQGQPIPSVDLNYPQEGDTVQVTGSMSFTGQINASNLQRWEVQYAPVGSEQWTTISTGQQQFPQGGSQIAQWDTSIVNNNTYRVRLAAYSQSGGFIFREATVQVQNIPPTPLPTMTPIPPSPTPFGSGGGFTPIPFESTPTATISGI